MHRRVLIEYVRPLLQARLVCTSAKMRARVAARLGDEARQLRELFGRLVSAGTPPDSLAPAPTGGADPPRGAETAVPAGFGLALAGFGGAAAAGAAGAGGHGGAADGGGGPGARLPRRAVSGGPQGEEEGGGQRTPGGGGTATLDTLTPWGWERGGTRVPMGMGARWHVCPHGIGEGWHLCPYGDGSMVAHVSLWGQEHGGTCVPMGKGAWWHACPYGDGSVVALVSPWGCEPGGTCPPGDRSEVARPGRTPPPRRDRGRTWCPHGWQDAASVLPGSPRPLPVPPGRPPPPRPAPSPLPGPGSPAAALGAGGTRGLCRTRPDTPGRGAKLRRLAGFK